MDTQEAGKTRIQPRSSDTKSFHALHPIKLMLQNGSLRAKSGLQLYFICPTQSLKKKKQKTGRGQGEGNATF